MVTAAPASAPAPNPAPSSALVRAIAANRFGLGVRPGAKSPADPRADLLHQFDSFDPRPPGIAAAPGSAAMAAQLRGFRDQLRALAAASAGTAPAAMATPTAMVANAKSGAQVELRKVIGKQFRDGYAVQVGARFNTALVTDTPFCERLVHFWANHFAISADKLETIGLAGTLEFEAIRPHIAGRFGDLLLAVETHPAMLLYLDQAQSIGPDSPLGAAARRRPNARRKPGLNENLAREILELHTLGVGSGYGQADVQELARALTGFSIGGYARAPLGIAAPDGAFVFQDAWHQPGPRTLLGRTYAAGAGQGRAILADLAFHPATARHLATKLARHFVADVPPPGLVDRLAAAHVASGGELMALYRVLVAAPESWAVATPKFKTPWDWTVSALRATDTRAAPDLRVVAALTGLGQPVWRPGSPAGWDDIAASWAAPDALLRRVEFAGRMAAAVGDRLDPRALAPLLLPGVLSAATTAAIARADRPQQGLALLLAAPEFLRR